MTGSSQRFGVIASSALTVTLCFWRSASLAGMESTAPAYDPSKTLPRLLSGQEVAELLGGASMRTVRRLAQEGVLERVRIGHRTSRYTQRSVLALIDPQDDHDPGANRAVGKVGNDDARPAP